MTGVQTCALPISFHAKLLRRARAHTRRIAARYRAAELARIVERTRRDGEVSRMSVRWILYHVLEHFAGHYGQILLLRHLYRDRKR